MKKLRHLRPLPLFLMVSGAYLPLLITICFGDFLEHKLIGPLLGNDAVEFMGACLFVANVVGIPLYWNWRVRLPFELAKTIPPNLRPNMENFVPIYWLPLLTFIGLLTCGMAITTLFPGGLGKSWIVGVVPTVVATIFFGSWLFSYGYTSRLTALLLRTAELGRKPKRGEVTATFVLVLLGVFGAPFLADRYRALHDWDGDLA